MDSVLMETIQTNDVKAIFYVINKKKSAGEKNIFYEIVKHCNVIESI
jgi:hypothetical protein